MLTLVERLRCKPRTPTKNDDVSFTSQITDVVRSSLRPSRRRLLQQLLIESLLVALMGTAAGLAAVPTVSQSLFSMLLSGSGLRVLYLDTSLGGTMFAYAALVAITATFLIDGVANINSLKIFDSAYTTVRGKPFAAR